MRAFPACRHKKPAGMGVPPGRWQWLASEPYRLFFVSGVLWSIVGVSLWPLFYANHLGFYPGSTHAKLMVEAFGGAFLVGFLGTAGPRMASAPRLSPAEFCWLMVLHQASAVCHLSLRAQLGDALFAGLLASLLVCLATRVIRFKKEPIPPQMLLALTGLLCGIVGALMHMIPAFAVSPERVRIANLLLYQGMLLPPVLGVGAFIFPRMLGGASVNRETLGATGGRCSRAAGAAVLIVGSLFLEAAGHSVAGPLTRAMAAMVYLVAEVRWERRETGSLTSGLYWALALGWLGLALPPFRYAQRIPIEHLLYIGGFGMLMLVVGSRVLFGHSGNLPQFFVKSNWVRFLVFLGVLAAATRATPAWVPMTTISHHIYAAITWIILSVCWLTWHRRRFLARETDGEAETPSQAPK
ncbi:MAG: NnrS family protein [Verrucomicrobiales bacterium]